MNSSIEIPAESSTVSFPENLFPGAQGYEVLSPDNWDMFTVGAVIVPFRYNLTERRWIISNSERLQISHIELFVPDFFEAYLTLMQRYSDVVYCFDKSSEN